MHSSNIQFGYFSFLTPFKINNINNFQWSSHEYFNQQIVHSSLISANLIKIMWSIIYIFTLLLTFINAAPLTQGTRANVSLYLESSDELLNNKVLYTANQGNFIHFYYVGEESILFATTFMYDGANYRLYEQQKGSNDKYYLTILDSMLRGQKIPG